MQKISSKPVQIKVKIAERLAGRPMEILDLEAVQMKPVDLKLVKIKPAEMKTIV